VDAAAVRDSAEGDRQGRGGFEATATATEPAAATAAGATGLNARTVRDSAGRHRAALAEVLGQRTFNELRE
jgi:hypothetical protein